MVNALAILATLPGLVSIGLLAFSHAAAEEVRAAPPPGNAPPVQFEPRSAPYGPVQSASIRAKLPSETPPIGPPLPDGKLALDAETQQVTVPFGTAQVSFSFVVSNVSSEPIVITGVRATCGCTKPKLPATPWTLDSGSKGTIEVAMNLEGKRGAVNKTLTVITDHGFKTLQVRTNIQEPPAGAMNPDERMRKLRIASVSRQAVLRGECASCHGTPALGKVGAELYQTACTVCHEAEHRSPVVPDLKHLQKATDAGYWRTWITSSEEGKFMPAFAIEYGGILTPGQIDSLVAYLTETFPSTIPTKPVPGDPATASSGSGIYRGE
ncbi:MAG TPA: DUF1573 domain-containing protein [Chthoniobacterales bacterium]